MSENNTVSREMPAILAELWQLLEGAGAIFGQERVYWRGVALVIAELLTLGRHTLTQLIRTLGAIDQDWSAWYRLFEKQRFNEEAAGRYIVQCTLEEVSEAEPYVVTVDGVITYRSGEHVAGSSLWRGKATVPYQRGLQYGQRFVGLAWLTPEENSYCRAIPLR